MGKPPACNARSADSRPEPGPLTSTSSVRTPCSAAFLPASSAATCAAYGVDLWLPLDPIVPADDHGNGVALGIGDGDHGVVEAGVHMRDARGDVLAFTAPNALRFTCHNGIPDLFC